MTFKARLNTKFYIVSVLLFCLVVFVWYGIYFINTNEILMEGDTPMDAGTKAIFTVLISIIALSWTVSLAVLIRQAIIGSAFCMDESGIHSTATAIMLLAFIFVTPIKTIPYSAITQVSDEVGILTLKLDKSKVEVLPIFRFLVRGEYHFFCGFTKEKQEDIKQALEQLMKQDELETPLAD